MEEIKKLVETETDELTLLIGLRNIYEKVLNVTLEKFVEELKKKGSDWDELEMCWTSPSLFVHEEKEMEVIVHPTIYSIMVYSEPADDTELMFASRVPWTSKDALLELIFADKWKEIFDTWSM